MLRAVLFDLGDTLIDFEPMDTRAVFRRAAQSTYAFLARRGCLLPPFDAYCKAQFWGVRWAYLRAKLTGREFNSLELLRKFCRRMALPHDEATLHELAWLWYEPLTHHARAERDLRATLVGLREAGLRLGIVSNTFVPGAVLDRHLAAHDLLNLFPVRVYSSEVGYRKPDPRIFKVALARLGVRAADAMFVGDLVQTDILGAKRLGMRTVLKLPWGGRGPRRGADHVVRQVTDLTDLLPGLLAPSSQPLDPRPPRELAPVRDVEDAAEPSLA